MNDCEHKPIIEGGANACPQCPPIPTQASMDKIVAVGFGVAQVTRDGTLIADGEAGRIWWQGQGNCTPTPVPEEDFITFGQVESWAELEPDHDWQIILHGPLHGETYQRQGPGVWLIIERNEGFA